MSKMAILDLCSSVGALQYGNRCLTHVAAFFPSVLPAARRRPEFGGPLCPTCVSAACERSKPLARACSWRSRQVAASAPTSLASTSTTTASESVASTTANDNQAEAPDPFSGAEWAGWECRFSSEDGSRLAVPEDYVPESLREWDVEVWGFETLTSEEWRHAATGKEGEDGSSVLYRKRARVYPEVGCALDNLSLEVNVQVSPLQGEGVFFARFPGGDYLLAKKTEGSDALRLEVGLVPEGGFGPGVWSKASGEEAKNDPGNERVRSRFKFELRSTSQEAGGRDCQLGPVTVTRERKYEEGFNDGLLYKGGGLDSQKLGRLLGSKCFAEDEEALTPAELSGEWKSYPGHMKMFNSKNSEADEDVLSSSAASSSSSSQETAASTQSHKPESFWTTNETGQYNENDNNRKHEDRSTGTLLRGGFTLRRGAYPGETPGLWGAAGEMSTGGEKAWAVEVGWVLEADGVGGRRLTRREVVTTVIGVEQMVPLGVWRGSESRP